MQRKYVRMKTFISTKLFAGILLFLSFDNPYCAGLTTQTPEPTFADQPSGSTTTFKYGDTRTVTITMKCKVNNLQPGQSVSWLKGLDDIVISDNHTVRTVYLVDTDRYSIYGNETCGEYYLKIEMVSYQTAEFDDGRYGCAVFYDDPTLHAAAKRSNVVQQNIYVVPRIIYPECFFKVNHANATIMTNVTVGDRVILSCQSDAGYPTVTMSWHKGNSSTNLTDSVSVADDTASVEYTWIPNVSDVDVIFKCVIDHPAFTVATGKRSNTSCLIGPFHIQQHSTTQHSTVASHKQGNTNGESYESLPTTSLTGSKIVSPSLTNSPDEQNSTVVIAVSSSIAAVIVILIIVISIVVCVKISRNKSQHSNGDQKIIGNPYAVDTMDDEVGYSEVKPHENVDAHRDRGSGVGGRISNGDFGESSFHKVDDLSLNENSDTNRILTESADENRKQEAVYAFPDKSKKTKGVAREDFTEASPERKVAERSENKPPGSKTAGSDYAIIPAEDLAHTNKVNVYDEVQNSDKNTDKNKFEKGKDDVNPKMKINVEGLSYADLDLTQLPTNGKRRRMDENRTVYAELQL